MSKTTIISRHIKALTIYYILDALADWILDPFMACEGVVDGWDLKMVINYPAYSDPIRTITITPHIITDEYGNEYVVYNWTEAEMAEIEYPFMACEGIVDG